MAASVAGSVLALAGATGCGATGKAEGIDGVVVYAADAPAEQEDSFTLEKDPSEWPPVCDMRVPLAKTTLNAAELVNFLNGDGPEADSTVDIPGDSRLADMLSNPTTKNVYFHVVWKFLSTSEADADVNSQEELDQEKKSREELARALAQTAAGYNPNAVVYVSFVSADAAGSAYALGDAAVLTYGQPPVCDAA